MDRGRNPAHMNTSTKESSKTASLMAKGRSRIEVGDTLAVSKQASGMAKEPKPCLMDALCMRAGLRMTYTTAEAQMLISLDRGTLESSRMATKLDKGRSRLLGG